MAQDSLEMAYAVINAGSTYDPLVISSARDILHRACEAVADQDTMPVLIIGNRNISEARIHLKVANAYLTAALEMQASKKLLQRLIISQAASDPEWAVEHAKLEAVQPDALSDVVLSHKAMNARQASGMSGDELDDLLPHYQAVQISNLEQPNGKHVFPESSRITYLNNLVDLAIPERITGDELSHMITVLRKQLPHRITPERVSVLRDELANIGFNTAKEEDDFWKLLTDALSADATHETINQQVALRAFIEKIKTLINPEAMRLLGILASDDPKVILSALDLSANPNESASELETELRVIIEENPTARDAPYDRLSDDERRQVWSLALTPILADGQVIERINATIDVCLRKAVEELETYPLDKPLPRTNELSPSVRASPLLTDISNLRGNLSKLQYRGNSEMQAIARKANIKLTEISGSLAATVSLEEAEVVEKTSNIAFGYGAGR